MGYPKQKKPRAADYRSDLNRAEQRVVDRLARGFVLWHGAQESCIHFSGRNKRHEAIDPELVSSLWRKKLLSPGPSLSCPNGTTPYYLTERGKRLAEPRERL